MRIRIKERVSPGVKRIDSSSKIDNVEFNEELINPEKALISLYFRGENSSGILDLTQEEANKLINSLKSVTKITKPSKK